MHKNSIEGSIAMPWCPKCGAEYIKGFKKCRDCDVMLVDELGDKFSEDTLDAAIENKSVVCNEHVQEVLLVTIDDLAKFSYVTSMLQSEDIIYWVMEHNVGQYTQIVYGLNLYGKSIYVSEHDVDRAMEILESYIPDELPEEAYDTTEEDSDDGVLKRFYYRHKVAIKLLRAAFYISFLVYLISNAINN